MLKALRYVFVLVLIALLVLGYRVLPVVKFDSDLMALFPRDSRNLEIAQANEVLSEAVNQKVFFLLSSSDWTETKQATATFAQTLRGCDCFADVVARQNLEGFAQLRQRYMEYAPVLLSKKDKVLLQQGQGETLVSSSLKSYVDNPAATSNTNIKQDPLATVDDFIAGLKRWVAGKGMVDEGYLYFADATADRQYLWVVAELKNSPYSLEVQTAAEEAIEAAQAVFARSVSEPQILRTGTLFFALAETAQTRAELAIVAIGSLLIIVVLVLFIFHSLRSLFLSLLQIAIAGIVGLTATQLVFGSVHIIALAIGASVLGPISIFSLRLQCKWQAQGNDWRAQENVADLMPGLSIGLVTAAMGYLALLIAGFAGLRQAAVFSAAGLAAGYMTVVGIYPWVLRTSRPVAAPRWMIAKIPPYLTVARRRLRCLKHPEWILPFVVLVAIGFWQLETQDDPSTLRTPNIESLTEQNRFHELVNSVAPTQYLLVKADTQEALLHKLEQLQPALEQPNMTDAVVDYTHLAQWLPSQEAQLENNELIRQQLVATGRLEDYLNTVSTGAQTELAQFQTEPDGNLLVPESILPLLHDLLQYPLYYTDGDKHYGYILFKGIQNTEPLQQLAIDNEKVFWVDDRAVTQSLLKHYRHFASGVLVVFYLLLIPLLCLRYGVKGALVTAAPPLLASLIAMAALGWLGIGLSAFTILALLLILGIGVIYPILLREKGGRDYDTFFSAGLSCLVILCALVLLSLSDAHAVFSFSITLLLGIAAGFILSPLALPSNMQQHK